MVRASKNTSGWNYGKPEPQDTSDELDEILNVLGSVAWQRGFNDTQSRKESFTIKYFDDDVCQIELSVAKSKLSQLIAERERLARIKEVENAKDIVSRFPHNEVANYIAFDLSDRLQALNQPNKEEK